ncbi:MAG: thiamine phosphate synthase superfamily [Thiotrichales bacterium]|nr:thiamine phosphate synthase superfamily [Thiotrichales bacterium]
MTTESRLHVVAGVVARGGQVFLARRPAHLHQGGLLEFPGGKLESGESAHAALKRELQEEIGITANTLEPLIRIPHDYSDKQVLLDVWRVADWSGEPHGKEGQQAGWFRFDELHADLFPAANVSILTALRLPESYLISPEPCAENHYGLRMLHQTLKAGVRLVQLRSKRLDADALRPRVIQYAALGKSYGARLLVNTHVDLVPGTGADGVHLTSKQLFAFDKRPLPSRFLVSASCHDAQELERAVAIGADFVTLSPVTPTDSHPDVEAMGWKRFAELVDACPIPVYALGGVARSELSEARQRGAQGVAGITRLAKDYGG